MDEDNLIQRYAAAFDLRTQTLLIFHSQVPTFQATVERYFENPDELRYFVDRFMVKVTERIDTLVDDSVRILLDVYTLEEFTALVEFCETDVGGRIARKMAIGSQRGHDLGRSLGTEIVNELLIELSVKNPKRWSTELDD